MSPGSDRGGIDPVTFDRGGNGCSRERSLPGQCVQCRNDNVSAIVLEEAA
jgi:hypothetical protein